MLLLTGSQSAYPRSCSPISNASAEDPNIHQLIQALPTNIEIHQMGLCERKLKNVVLLRALETQQEESISCMEELLHNQHQHLIVMQLQKEDS